MAVGGIGGSTPFPVYVFERAPPSRERGQGPPAEDEARSEPVRQAQQAEDDRRARREAADRLDVAKALADRVIDPTDQRRAPRGSIVDIEV